MPNLEEYKKMADLLFPNITKTPEDYYNMYPKRNLPEGAEVTRFAPSPTGYMHIGGIYQCLINRAVAGNGGVFYLRNEDTDSKREVAGSADIFVPICKEFGIEFNEGFVSETESKGNYGPYIQSKRVEIYQTFVKYLVSRGLAYPCFCTEEDKDAKDEQIRLGLPLGYYGRWAKCRDLSLEQVEKNVKEGKPFTIRIKSNGDGTKRFKFHDLRIGDTVLPVNFNDYIILKSDGQTLYHLAHLVDDTLMHTSIVIRDESWFPSIPLHVQLFEYMGLTPPKYLHTPTINTIDAETGTVRKVSKRKDNWADARWFGRQGYPISAVLDYLMNILNSNFEPWRNEHPNAPISDFEFKISNLSKSGALFDIAKIDNVSKNVISKLNGEQIYQNTLKWAKENKPEYVEVLENNKDYAIKVFNMDKNLARPRKDITTFAEVVPFYSYMFNQTYVNTYEELDYEKIGKSNMLQALTAYLNTYSFNTNKDDWFFNLKETAGTCGFATDMKVYKQNPENFVGSVADFSTILRVAITGKRQTPDLYEIMQTLGEQEVKTRLNNAINFLSK